jgi:hypothetical protein
VVIGIFGRVWMDNVVNPMNRWTMKSVHVIARLKDTVLLVATCWNNIFTEENTWLSFFNSIYKFHAKQQTY